MHSVEQFIRVLEASVAPSLLISGFGFLLLTMTTRLGRAIDRIRTLNQDIETLSGKKKENICKQIKALWQRSQYLQTAIAMLTFSIFFVSVIILLLFSSLVFNIRLIAIIQLLFATSVICLCISLFFFLLDIRVALQSIKLDVQDHVDIR